MSIDNPLSDTPVDIATLTDLANQLFKGLPFQAMSSNGHITQAQRVDSSPIATPSDSAFENSRINDSDVNTPAITSALDLNQLLSTKSTLENTLFHQTKGPEAYLPTQMVAKQTSHPTGLQVFHLSQLNQTTLAKKFEPLQTVQLPFEMELNTILKSIPNTLPSAQLEQLNSGDSDPSKYYFLNESSLFQSHLGLEKNSLQQSNPAITPSFSQHQQSNLLNQSPIDVNQIRLDFPILKEQINGRRLVWLDNAATTHKPRAVIERIKYFYEHENSNIHRAAHTLAARATDAYEGARDKIRQFINARHSEEIIFVRGTTEAINLVAQSWGRQHINAHDEILISWLEHHANIVPWQQLCQQTGAKLKVIPVDDTGQICLTEYAKLLNPKTKLVSFTHVSNALGTVTPAQQMINMAHQVGAKVLLDGAQSISHMRIDLQKLDADFFVFSGHKVFGPTGIGVLYGKESLLNEMQPWQGGGNMIKDVTFEHTTYQNSPNRFEAGTGNIADAVGLGAAIDYINRIGIDLISMYEHQLLIYATHHLQQIPGLKLIGTADNKTSVLSFTLHGFKNEEVGNALNKEGIAVRSGHHCAQPILRRFGLESTVRPSLAFYNTCADIDILISTLIKISSGKSL